MIIKGETRQQASKKMDVHYNTLCSLIAGGDIIDSTKEKAINYISKCGAIFYDDGIRLTSNKSTGADTIDDIRILLLSLQIRENY